MCNKALPKCTLFLVLTAVLVNPALVAWDQQSDGSKPSVHKVTAYYFHTDTRCSTCIKIEAYSKEAIEQGFPEELKNGILEMKIVNYENPENQHFIKDYKLVTKSLILANTVNGKQTKWTNLNKVWELTERKDAFLKYVQKEVRNFLLKGR
jgi:hypothetical protein